MQKRKWRQWVLLAMVTAVACGSTACEQEQRFKLPNTYKKMKKRTQQVYKPLGKIKIPKNLSLPLWSEMVDSSVSSVFRSELVKLQGVRWSRESSGKIFDFYFRSKNHMAARTLSQIGNRLAFFVSRWFGRPFPGRIAVVLIPSSAPKAAAPAPRPLARRPLTRRPATPRLVAPRLAAPRLAAPRPALKRPVDSRAVAKRPAPRVVVPQRPTSRPIARRPIVRRDAPKQAGTKQPATTRPATRPMGRPANPAARPTTRAVVPARIAPRSAPRSAPRVAVPTRPVPPPAARPVVKPPVRAPAPRPRGAAPANTPQVAPRVTPPAPRPTGLQPPDVGTRRIVIYTGTTHNPVFSRFGLVSVLLSRTVRVFLTGRAKVDRKAFWRSVVIPAYFAVRGTGAMVDWSYDKTSKPTMRSKLLQLGRPTAEEALRTLEAYRKGGLPAPLEQQARNIGMSMVGFLEDAYGRGALAAILREQVRQPKASLAHSATQVMGRPWRSLWGQWYHYYYMDLWRDVLRGHTPLRAIPSSPGAPRPNKPRVRRP